MKSNKYLKIPRMVTEYVIACPEFMLTLFYLWMECDYFTGRGRFTIQQIVDLSGAGRTTARVARIMRSLQVLINSEILELPSIEDITTAKPRQVLDANFRYKFFYEVENEYVIVRQKFVERLLSMEYEGNRCNPINLLFLALAKKGCIEDKTNFSRRHMAKDLKISSHELERCIASLVKTKICAISPSCGYFNYDSVTLLLSIKLDSFFDDPWG